MLVSQNDRLTIFYEILFDDELLIVRTSPDEVLTLLNEMLSCVNLYILYQVIDQCKTLLILIITLLSIRLNRVNKLRNLFKLLLLYAGSIVMNCILHILRMLSIIAFYYNGLGLFLASNVHITQFGNVIYL